MNLKNLKFVILGCLLAGFSLVTGDDRKVAVAPKDSCFGRLRACTYNGILIPEGQTKTVAPCQYGTCDRGKVQIAIADCPPPKDGCRYQSTMKECCKLVCGKGCTYNGISIPDGQTKTVAPCQYGTCDRGKVYIAIEDCGPLETGCRYESTMEECCKRICDKGCTYKGIFIPEGETKTVAPCQFASCFDGELAIAVADCAAPLEGCHIESTMEECCKQVCDKGCAYNGIFIPEGETKTVAPCEFASCFDGEVAIAVADCAAPLEGCRIESTMEECCKQVCDKGCAYNGIFIPEGETRTVAPCQFASCFYGEVAISVADCAPPRNGCRIVSTMDECCKQICDEEIVIPVDGPVLAK